MDNLKNEIKKMKAITLIALIITIVVLIILATIVINLSLGENGLFNKAKYGTESYTNAQVKEEKDMQDIYSKILVSTGGTTQIDYETLASTILKLQNPVGTVISCIRSNMPDGYLACDGSKYSTSTYPDLFNALKDLDHTGWAEADWETEFTVPDLRGEFLRGTGTNGHTNQGSGANVGIHQDGTTIPNIQFYNGQILFKMQSSKNGAPYNLDKYIYNQVYGGNSAPGNNSGGSETGQWTYASIRPTNTSVLYCIKY